MEKLLAEPFFHDLVDGGQVVATRLLHPELPNARHVMKEGWSAAVEHQPVENKREDYADYNAENFESEVRRRFSVRDRLKLKGGLRELFLLEPANGR